MRYAAAPHVVRRYKTDVTLPLPLYAGFWRRAGAVLIDALLLSLPSLVYERFAGDQADVWMGFALWALVDGLYYSGFHASRWQATPGKRAFGIKVTDLTGARISLPRALVRYFASWLSALLLCIGYLMAAWTPRKQALHDRIAATLVVNAAVRPEAVPTASGVMPVAPRTGMAIALLAMAMAAVTWANIWLADDTGTVVSRGNPVVTATPTREQRISYVIYTFPFFSGEQRLVAEGVRVYRHEEVLESHYPEGESPFTRKVLPIAAGYELEAMIVPEARVEGFGISIARDGGGFSWEWFDRESEEVFCKRQGEGRVRVRFAKRDGKEELAEVVFLDDITMRLDRWQFIPFKDGKSDHLVVKKGSVLWLAD